MFGRHKEYFSKKYRRRTLSIMLMYFMTLMSAFHEDERGTMTDDLKLATAERLYENYKPFAPYTQLLHADEIKITWLPVFHQQYVPNYHELYNGEELEYVGQDLFHIAKRLKYQTEYVFKLRVCSNLPGDCSKFSIQRFQRTGRKADTYPGENFNAVLSIFGTNFLTVPASCLLFMVVMTTFLIWCFMSCVLSFFNTLQTDINIMVLPITYTVPHDDGRNSEMLSIKLTQIGILEEVSLHIDENEIYTLLANKKDKYILDKVDTKSHLKVMKPEIYTTAAEKDSFPNQENDKLETKSDNTSSGSEEMSASIKKQSCVSEAPKRQKKRHCRKRSRTAPTADFNRTKTRITEASLSDSEVKESKRNEMISFNNWHANTKSPPNNIVVVIDNSNIFIGAREAACHGNPCIRPRHVKLRLNQLLHLVESGRHVTRGITGASSATITCENVWDIYRRAGYIVDLEDRRGKDEQRVDEQLHLAIYKALVELPAQTLVIATGDGNKGKSKSSTSFVECAKRAIYLGWNVEILSWQHCLSVEWLKLVSTNESKIQINYLDGYLDQLTTIEKRHQR